MNPVGDGVRYLLFKAVERKPDYIRVAGIPCNAVCIYSGECGYVRVNQRPGTPENPLALCTHDDSFTKYSGDKSPEHKNVSLKKERAPSKRKPVQ
jgi:hypothetical protein